MLKFILPGNSSRPSAAVAITEDYIFLSKTFPNRWAIRIDKVSGRPTTCSSQHYCDVCAFNPTKSSRHAPCTKLPTKELRAILTKYNTRKNKGLQ